MTALCLPRPVSVSWSHYTQTIMASDRDLQTLEENEEDLLAVNTSIRVECYRYEPRRVPAPSLSDDSSTEGSDNDESEGEMGDDTL